MMKPCYGSDVVAFTVCSHVG